MSHNPIQRRFVSIHGRQVHYRIAGQGPALLLIHQSPQNSRMWLAMMQRYADRYTVIAPDTPGFGYSDPLPGNPMTIAEFGAATMEFVEAIGLQVRQEPLAGMFVWVDSGQDSETLARAAAAQGVLLAPGVLFSAQQRASTMLRLPVSMVDDPASMAVLQRCVAAGDDNEQARSDIALAFQQAVVETLTIKCKRALKQAGMKRLVIAGGVSANKALRASLETMLGGMNGQVFYARPEFCTDNGAMIAFAGCQRLQAGQHESLAISVQARWPMEQLKPL